MPQVPDPYRALGVKPNATKAQIKAAHRALAKRYHPDAQGGDAVSFLLVQEAYKLLSDPLRRREWDARHAPGPVRAGQPAAPRPRAADGRGTRAGRAKEAPTDPWRAGRRTAATDQQPPPVGRDPAVRRYTWSASEVPWWEEGGPRENRRQPGGRRAREAPPAASQPGTRSPRAGGSSPRGRACPAGPAGSSGDQPPVYVAQDFEVYNRSSGAAWSMAARAYFRRGDQDLPRRGSFRHEGSQPLTAARARVAAEEQARRQSASLGADPEEATSAPPGAAPPGSARSTPPASSARPASRARAAYTPSAPAAPATRPGPGARPAPPPAPADRAPTYGVARDVEGISEARQQARQRASAAAWPSLSQRLLLALVAWIPLAIAIGYGGAVATGCDRAAISCPSYLEPVQLLLIGLALAVLVALPRVAYVAALATVGLLGGSALIVAGVWLLGLQRPISTFVLAISSALLLVIYLATATWIVAGRPRRRPWSA